MKIGHPWDSIHTTIEQLARSRNEYYKTDSRRGPVAALTGYFDESGKLGDSQVVVFAGFLCDNFLAQCLAHDWRAVLNREGLDYFRMSEAIHLQGQFQGWLADRRDRVVLELAQELKRRYLVASITAERVGAFKQRPSHERERWSNNPHYAVFEGCILGLCLSMKDDSHTLSLVCDDEQEYSIECYKLLNKLKRNVPTVKAKVGSIVFADDQFYPAIQAADMLAYAARIETLEADTPKFALARRVLDICGPEDPEARKTFVRDVRAREKE